MANETSKPFSDRDFQQTLRASFNDVDKSLSVSGFLVGKVGYKVVRSTPSSTQEDYSFYDGTTLLYTFRLTYTATDLSTLVSAERIN